MAEKPDGPTGGGREFHSAQRRGRLLARLQDRLLEDPSDADALSRAGGVLYEMGRFDEAGAHLGKALSCFACPLTQQERVKSCPGGDSESSREKAAQLHYGVLVQLADCCAASRQWRLAEAYYKSASALSPLEPRPYLCLGTLALQGNDVAEAERCFRAAVEVQGDSSEAYCGLAMACQRGGQYARAFDMYLRALELDTDNLVALLGLFQTSCEMGTFSKIIHYLEAYLQVHPEDGSVRFCLATLYAREGRLLEARRAVLKVLAEQPKEEAEQLLAEINEALAEIEERQKAAT